MLFRSITKSYYRNSVGVLAIYDITNRASFQHVENWVKEAALNLGGPNPSKCVFQLVGTKCDMGDQRQVVFFVDFKKR